MMHGRQIDEDTTLDNSSGVKSMSDRARCSATGWKSGSSQALLSQNSTKGDQFTII